MCQASHTCEPNHSPKDCRDLRLIAEIRAKEGDAAVRIYYKALRRKSLAAIEAGKEVA